MPLKGNAASTLNPSGVMSRGSGQQGIAAQAAQKYGVSAPMLWGIYGTESSFGANPGNSSAGAQGPMQFIPSTWAKYGGGGNVQDLSAAMPAAAHYLHDLGATTDITDPKTVAAINAYNGNGGGSSTGTSYYQSVLGFAKSYTGAGSAATHASNSGNGTATPASSGGGSLWDIITGDISSLPGLLAMALVSIAKDIWTAAWDVLVVPVWHRNQLAVWYYGQNVLLNQDGKHKLYVTMPANAAFWGLGYALLFVDPESGSVKPAPIRRSRVTRHARRLQAVPARRQLTKPSQVKAETPDKPKPRMSSVTVNQVGTMTATRTRPVTTQGDLKDGGGTAGTPIEEVRTASEGAPRASRTQPHAGNPGGRRTHEGRGTHPPRRPANRGG